MIRMVWKTKKGWGFIGNGIDDFCRGNHCIEPTLRFYDQSWEITKESRYYFRNHYHVGNYAIIIMVSFYARCNKSRRWICGRCINDAFTARFISHRIDDSFIRYFQETKR